MQRSIEALEDADLLEARGRWNAAANRMYYACFYAISAFLIHKRIRATTHAGLKSMFNKEMVRTGIVSKEDGLLFNQLFQMRQEADYEDFQSIRKEDIASVLPKVKSLVYLIQDYIANN